MVVAPVVTGVGHVVVRRHDRRTTGLMSDAQRLHSGGLTLPVLLT